MVSNDEKTEVEVMVLADLAAICKKLALSPALTDDGLRQEAARLAKEFDSLSPSRGKGTAAEHNQGEVLLIRIARFLPRVLEIHAEPRTMPADRRVA